MTFGGIGPPRLIVADELRQRLRRRNHTPRLRSCLGRHRERAEIAVVRCVRVFARQRVDKELLLTADWCRTQREAGPSSLTQSCRRWVRARPLGMGGKGGGCPASGQRILRGFGRRQSCRRGLDKSEKRRLLRESAAFGQFGARGVDLAPAIALDVAPSLGCRVIAPSRELDLRLATQPS